MPQDEPIPGSVLHWLARASGHLALAQSPKPAGAYWEDLAFHTQQAAELAIKAVYQHHDLVFRFTHNLESLMTELSQSGVAIPSQVYAAVKLTRYATRARYPGAASHVR